MIETDGILPEDHSSKEHAPGQALVLSQKREIALLEQEITKADEDWRIACRYERLGNVMQEDATFISIGAFMAVGAAIAIAFPVVCPATLAVLVATPVLSGPAAYFGGKRLAKISYAARVQASQREGAARGKIQAIEYERDTPERLRREQQQREAQAAAERQRQEASRLKAERAQRIADAAGLALDAVIKAAQESGQPITKERSILFEHPDEAATDLQIRLSEATTYTPPGKPDECRQRIIGAICAAPRELAKGEPLPDLARIERDIPAPAPKNRLLIPPRPPRLPDGIANGSAP